MWDSDDVRVFTDGLQTIGDTFARFAYLETVVLETGYALGAKHVPPLLEVLRKVCRADVRHRTSAEAHELALQVKKSPSRSMSAGLLSPLWCLQGHTKQWKNW